MCMCVYICACYNKATAKTAVQHEQRAINLKKKAARISGSRFCGAAATETKRRLITPLIVCMCVCVCVSAIHFFHTCVQTAEYTVYVCTCDPFAEQIV